MGGNFRSTPSRPRSQSVKFRHLDAWTAAAASQRPARYRRRFVREQGLVVAARWNCPTKCPAAATFTTSSSFASTNRDALQAHLKERSVGNGDLLPGARCTSRSASPVWATRRGRFPGQLAAARADAGLADLSGIVRPTGRLCGRLDCRVLRLMGGRTAQVHVFGSRRTEGPADWPKNGPVPTFLQVFSSRSQVRSVLGPGR